MRKTLILGLLVVLAMGLFIPCVRAEDMSYAYASPDRGPSAYSVLADVFVVRPLGIVACAVGLGASIVAMPFAIPAQSTGTVYQKLVADPFYFTFGRPLGEGF